jgi:hydroxyacylglutathione hydrolase
VSYAVADTSRADEPVLLFTGGSLLVGAVGRTDLLGAENAIPYARAMFHSLHDVLLKHEEFVGVYPTHGGGSLCSTGIASTPNSTIGFERRYNPMLAPREIDEFARILLADQPAFPPYFARMRPINQAGPRLLGGIPTARPMTIEEVKAGLARDALLVDLRPPAAHATAHVSGSVSIPAGTSFSTWLGWIVDFDRPIVLLLDDPADWDDAIRQALRIGHETVLGYVDGGFARWVESGGATEKAEQITIDELARRLRTGPDAPFVIDVRQRSEFEEGHIAGSVHIFAGELASRVGDMPRDRPIVTICASGYRSSVAASLLRQAGFTSVSAVAGGVPAWDAAGHPVERDDRGSRDEVIVLAEGSHGH